MSKTDLEALRIVGLLENCSYIQLDVGEWTEWRFQGHASYKSGQREYHTEPS